MTEVRFFHNAEDKLAAACRLTVAAWRHGRRVTVLVPEPGQAARLDALLWSFQPLAFVPHVRADSPLAAETPVVIADHLDGVVHEDVLIHLGDTPPEPFTRFGQVVEIVTQDAGDRDRARTRWAFYKQHGITPQANDLAHRDSP